MARGHWNYKYWQVVSPIWEFLFGWCKLCQPKNSLKTPGASAPLSARYSSSGRQWWGTTQLRWKTSASLATCCSHRGLSLCTGSWKPAPASSFLPTKRGLGGTQTQRWWRGGDAWVLVASLRCPVPKFPLPHGWTQFELWVCRKHLIWWVFI